jgi:hypothetical protein
VSDRVNVWQRDDKYQECNYCLSRNIPVITIRSARPNATLVISGCYRCMAEISSKITLLLGDMVGDDDEHS